MATQRPALTEIIERIEQDFVGRLKTAPARVALTRVLARGEAGLAHGLYGYIDTKEKNFFPDSGDEAAVLRWANLFNRPRLSPVQAVGTVQATGTNDAVIPAGRELKSSAGVFYAVDSDVTIASGVASVAITAVDRGIAGNLAAGAVLSFSQPVSGVLATVTVEAPGLTGGADVESIEALRVRVLSRMRSPPRGGAEDDYKLWAMEAHPDVTRAWVSGQEMSANSVTVRIVTDDAPGGMIPSSAVLEAVEDYINSPGRRPVTAELYVAAPIAVPMNPEIAISPTTQAVKDAVTAELQDLLKREAEPGGTILLSRINEAISNAAGESDHDLISPVANVTHTTGQIAVLGSITWSDL
jgi:uncharacterized phage protein gp47/JayE